MTKVLDGLGGKDNKNAANLNASTVIVIAGIAKVFVGELIEECMLGPFKFGSCDSTLFS